MAALSRMFANILVLKSDENSEDGCVLCLSGFSMRSRRFVCSLCQSNVCDACASNSFEIEHSGNHQRICDDCLCCIDESKARFSLKDFRSRKMVWKLTDFEASKRHSVEMRMTLGSVSNIPMYFFTSNTDDHCFKTFIVVISIGHKEMARFNISKLNGIGGRQGSGIKKSDSNNDNGSYSESAIISIDARSPWSRYLTCELICIMNNSGNTSPQSSTISMSKESVARGRLFLGDLFRRSDDESSRTKLATVKLRLRSKYRNLVARATANSLNSSSSKETSNVSSNNVSGKGQSSNSSGSAVSLSNVGSNGNEHGTNLDSCPSDIKVEVALSLSVLSIGDLVYGVSPPYRALDQLLSVKPWRLFLPDEFFADRIHLVKVFPPASPLFSSLFLVRKPNWKRDSKSNADIVCSACEEFKTIQQRQIESLEHFDIPVKTSKQSSISHSVASTVRCDTPESVFKHEYLSNKLLNAMSNDRFLPLKITPRHTMANDVANKENNSSEKTSSRTVGLPSNSTPGKARVKVTCQNCSLTYRDVVPINEVLLMSIRNVLFAKGSQQSESGFSHEGILLLTTHRLVFLCNRIYNQGYSTSNGNSPLPGTNQASQLPGNNSQHRSNKSIYTKISVEHTFSWSIAEISTISVKQKWKDSFHLLEFTTSLDNLLHRFAIERVTFHQVSGSANMSNNASSSVGSGSNNVSTNNHNNIAQQGNSNSSIQQLQGSYEDQCLFPNANIMLRLRFIRDEVMVRKEEDDFNEFRVNVNNLRPSRPVINYSLSDAAFISPKELFDEYSRQGVNAHSGFDVISYNRDYSLCPSYPPYLVLPQSCVDLSLLKGACKQRSQQRIPVVTHMGLHRFGIQNSKDNDDNDVDAEVLGNIDDIDSNYRHISLGLLCRSAQPHVGIMDQVCEQDQTLLLRIRESVSDINSNKSNGMKSCHQCNCPLSSSEKGCQVQHRDRNSDEAQSVVSGSPMDTSSSIVLLNSVRCSCDCHIRSRVRTVTAEDAWVEISTQSPKLPDSSDRMHGLQTIQTKSTNLNVKSTTAKETNSPTADVVVAIPNKSEKSIKVHQVKENVTTKPIIESNKITRPNNLLSLRRLRIFDARPLLSAQGNVLLGKGYENVSRLNTMAVQSINAASGVNNIFGSGELCSIEFLGIENIHAMRDSLVALRAALISVSTSNQSHVVLVKQPPHSSSSGTSTLLSKGGSHHSQPTMDSSPIQIQNRSLSATNLPVQPLTGQTNHGTEGNNHNNSNESGHINTSSSHGVPRNSEASAIYSYSSQNTCNSNFNQLIHECKWLQHLSDLIRGSLAIASSILQGDAVLVHCSDGWDRTSQLCAIAQVLIDPFYRTICGLKVLIDKEFIQFGHMFRLRGGIGASMPPTKDEAQNISPIFLQFLDALWQIWCQFPKEFEYSDSLLAVLATLYRTGFVTDFKFNQYRDYVKYMGKKLNNTCSNTNKNGNNNDLRGNINTKDCSSNENECEENPSESHLDDNNDNDEDYDEAFDCVHFWEIVDAHGSDFRNPLYENRFGFSDYLTEENPMSHQNHPLSTSTASRESAIQSWLSSRPPLRSFEQQRHVQLNPKQLKAFEGFLEVSANVSHLRVWFDVHSRDHRSVSSWLSCVGEDREIAPWNAKSHAYEDVIRQQQNEIQRLEQELRLAKQVLIANKYSQGSATTTTTTTSSSTSLPLQSISTSSEFSKQSVTLPPSSTSISTPNPL